MSDENKKNEERTSQEKKNDDLPVDKAKQGEVKDEGRYINTYTK